MIKYIIPVVYLFSSCQGGIGKTEKAKVEYIEFGLMGGETEPKGPVETYLLFPDKLFKINHYFEGNKDTILMGAPVFQETKKIIEEIPIDCPPYTVKSKKERPDNDAQSFFVHIYCDNKFSHTLIAGYMGEEMMDFEKMVWEVFRTLNDF